MSSPSNLTTPSNNLTNVAPPPTAPYGTLKPASTSGFVDLLDPYKKSSLKQKQRKSQGSSRYCITSDVELQQLPYLKGKLVYVSYIFCKCELIFSIYFYFLIYRYSSSRTRAIIYQ